MERHLASSSLVLTVTEEFSTVYLPGEARNAVAVAWSASAAEISEERVGGGIRFTGMPVDLQVGK